MSEKDMASVTMRSSLCDDRENKATCIYALGIWNDNRVSFTFEVPHAGKWTWHFYTDSLLRLDHISCRAGEKGATEQLEKCENDQETAAVLTLSQAGAVTVTCAIQLRGAQVQQHDGSAGVLQMCALAQREQELRENLRLAEEKCRILEEKNKKLSNKCSISEEINAELQQMEDREGQLEGECLQLRDKENQLKNEINALHQSRSWRLARVFASVLRFFVPVGSKRALFCRLLWTAVRHPVKVLKNLKPRKIKKFMRAWRRGDLASAKAMLHSGITGIPTPASIEVIPPVVEPVDTREKSFEDYPVLQIPQWDDPEVSIIIPVYNQFEFTYHCVSSLLKYSGNVHFEILIANDCSSDLTTRAEEILPGVKLITNEENLRFLRNCNHAAKAARGRYVLFLNNDTQVQRNWLRPLLTLIESAPDIGMVGSKLIYPDGHLQEAGGILWRDGSAWNFGSRQNPRMPEFNYVKETDYISGASIMLSRQLWEQIGGFDETFVPAYCEDSDLAFTVRKMGYRVMYQPRSVVVHFEGVSNGTDTTTGQKKYQVDNQAKFRAKWAEELAQHPENGVNVFQARDRSYGKKTLIMVDHYVPTYDKDAGSRTVYQYLKLFVQQGYNVKFIGDNFRAAEPYTTTLQQMGVEILYGPYYAAHWKDWVRENAEQIDYVFLNRPHIAPKYIDFFRENTKAKIVYYGHDLAFLREMREFEITGDPSFRDSAKMWQPKELELMKKADMAYYPSQVEVEEVHKIDPSVSVKAIPGYIFENVTWDDYDFSDRKDIMFIGGFSHRPNVDAVKWLAQEILPALLKLLPDVIVHVLGSNAPREVLALQNEHLVIEGFVTDEQLAWFYRHMRLSLVPLRYGAGIKGKVIEAIQYGTPVVTTPTGIEGILGAEDTITVASDAETIARKVAELYTDEERLRTISRRSVAYVQENYSEKNALQAIAEEFDFPEKEIV
jgi:GT2 family glycosyltransferase